MSYSGEKDPLLLGDLVIERELGQGGMGTVWLVRSVTTHERFAMKRAKHPDWTHQRNFLLELRTWCDVSEHRHPHIAESRFFRTLTDDKTGENQIAIFAEYVDGKSLHDWIRDGRLYEGGPARALERILDIAIQFAWGLHAAHELGIVHQDVKPSNLLLTQDGLAKVTDFGLARARAMPAQAAPVRPGQSAPVSAGLFTPEYCSPEQAGGLPLTRKTDIWGWGLSVMEMFMGERTWNVGTLAGRTLESCVQRGPIDRRPPPMPAGVVEVLRKCFRQDLAERWATMAEVTNALRNAYEEILTKNYARPVPAASTQGSKTDLVHDRWNNTGSQWAEPQAWLDQLPWKDRNKVNQAKSRLPARTGSRRSQAIADLLAYEDVRRIYALASSLRWVKGEVGNLLIHKGLVHQALNDMPGALLACDQAMDIFRSLGLEQFVARALENKGVVFLELRQPSEAMEYLDKCIKIRERLVSQGRVDLRNQLATAYYNQASTFAQLRMWDTALILSDKCIEIRREIIEEADAIAITKEMKREFAIAYMQRAQMNFQDANESEKNGSMTWVQAHNCRMLTVPFIEIAIQILEPFVPPLADSDGRIMRLESDGRYGDFPDLLAEAYTFKAGLLGKVGDPRALEAHDLAILHFQRVVNRQQKHEQAHRLAIAYENKAIFLDDPQGALALFNRALAIWNQLIRGEGKQQFVGDWARARLRRAKSLSETGDRKQAITDARDAFAVLQDEVVHKGRVDLQEVLDWAKEALGEVLQRGT
jgi:serine/threonine protein kinase